GAAPRPIPPSDARRGARVPGVAARGAAARADNCPDGRPDGCPDGRRPSGIAARAQPPLEAGARAPGGTPVKHTNETTHRPPHPEGLERYEPGKPVEEVQRESGIRRVVKLASNENPLGPSPAALAAAHSALAQAHRYPDGPATALRKALALKHGVEPTQIAIG